MILAPLQLLKIMSVWMSNEGLLLPAGAILVSLGNGVVENSLVRLTLYKKLFLTVIRNGAKALTLLGTDAAALHKIFGPMRVGNDFRIQCNNDLYKLRNDIDVV